MDIQHIVTYLIGAAVVAWIIRAVLRWWRGCRSGECAGCDDQSCIKNKKENQS